MYYKPKGLVRVMNTGYSIWYEIRMEEYLYQLIWYQTERNEYRNSVNFINLDYGSFKELGRIDIEW